MNGKIGFIGAGNMGGALAAAAVKSVAPENVFLADRSMEMAQQKARALSCQVSDTKQVAAECGMIFLGVKPQVLPSLMEEISGILATRQDEFVLVSMAAGVSMASIHKMAGKAYPLIRIMPNTPVAVGSGVILFDASENVTEEAQEAFCAAMEKGGLVDRLPEQLIDAASALSGCGPAFVCMFAEALADGAVACGLPRDKALTYAAQTLQGTAKLLLESGQHPGQLKDAVCSPGGSTIEGVRALEQNGFRGSTLEAVEAAYRRTKELGK